MQQLESAVRSTIEATPYSGTLTLTSTPYNSKIHIRPSNTLSRLLSNKWLRLLSILLLLFPFIWLFKRFHARGGGRWEVCGGAYALKRWVPLEPGEEAEAEAVLQESEELPPYGYDPRAVGLGMGGSGSALTRTIGSRGSRGSQRSARYMQTATGPKKLVGLKEGEWFRSWEGVITRAVMGGYQSSVPLPSRDRSGLPVRSLDGYDESLIEY
ncbi:hypothetical protein B0H34DRAFT_684280 [Crassisporium funariophilum]|nr:hypothetical protein B0H34DRAFT_684280 [Crassisporium funariophilum]